MGANHLMRSALSLAVCLLLAACGGSSTAEVSTPTAGVSAIAVSSSEPSQRLLDWPQFGLNPQRSNSSDLATGITAANVSQLRRTTVTLPGTVDSSPIYLHGALVGGASLDPSEFALIVAAA